jgi:hypothetical protein
VDVGACAVRRGRDEVSFGCSFCWVGFGVFGVVGRKGWLTETSEVVPDEEQDDEEEAREVEEGCLDWGGHG